MSDNKKPNMIEVPLARIPEEPGAVILHAGIPCGGQRATADSIAVELFRSGLYNNICTFYTQM